MTRRPVLSAISLAAAEGVLEFLSCEREHFGLASDAGQGEENNHPIKGRQSLHEKEE